MAEIPEIKLFGKWSLEDIEIQDISLTVSFCLRPAADILVTFDPYVPTSNHDANLHLSSHYATPCITGLYRRQG